MYSLSVRDHLMIAHSFSGEVFGPAQAMHGATYIVDMEFRVSKLDAYGLVVDIGLASTTLQEIIKPLNYQNLDELAEFEGQNTTTEYLAYYLFDQMATRVRDGALGPGGAHIEIIKVTLHESHIAWAAYEGTL